MVGPTIFVVLAGQAVELYEWASELVRSGAVADLWGKVAVSFWDRLQTMNSSLRSDHKRHVHFAADPHGSNLITANSDITA